MKRRRKKVVLSTTVSVYLALNVHARKDNGKTGLLTIPLVRLTTILLWWWNLQGMTQNLSWHLNRCIAGIQTRLDARQRAMAPGLTLLGIGVRSVLYGVGLTG